MASGPSDRGNCGIKGFDFGSDDILCSSEDFINHGSSNGSQVDPSKDFHISRMTKASTYPATAYNSPESSLSQDVITTVEKSMKTYADNLMQFLEGMSTRLSQLELYCYNLDKSIGEMRSELTSDHEEADSKLKSVEKHLQEIHRSVQILRDKQELAETQKELAKLQLVRKESSSSSHLQSNEEKSLPSAMYQKRTDNNASDTHNQQLALALPHQVAFQQQHVAPLSQAPAPNVTQATQHPRYYMPTTPLPNLPSVAQLPQNQYLPSDPQYRNPQSTSSQVTGQSPPVQQFSQYQLPQPQPQPQQQQWPQQLPQQGQPPQPQQQQQQQWPPKLPQQVQPPQPQQQQQQQWSPKLPQQVQPLQPQQQQQQQQWPPKLPQQVQPPQPPSIQSQMRTTASTNVYTPYLTSQATSSPPTDTLPNSMPMQMPYSGVPPHGSSHGDPMPYGYSGTGRTVAPQPPPQQIKGPFPAQPGDVYETSGTSGTHATLPPPASAYMMYGGEGSSRGRAHYPPPQPSHFSQAGYPPPSASLQNPAPPHDLMVRNPSQPQFIRGHPYNELIEKLVTMGFRADHVASVIQRMEETGQPVDFNSVLDRVNAHSSAVGTHRGW